MTAPKEISPALNVFGKLRIPSICGILSSDLILLLTTTLPFTLILCLVIFRRNKVFQEPLVLSSRMQHLLYSKDIHALLDTNKWNNFGFSHSNVIRYINKLSNGLAAGLDGITSELLKFAKDSSLALHLSVVYALCFRFGVVPGSFCSGLLIPVLKNSNLDPALPTNYRPITISVTFSKIMEYYILD